MNITRPSVLEVDLNAFRHNVSQIKKYVNNVELMPIIKASAYGTYINTRIDILNIFEIVAVALVDEAVELRKLGYDKDIFVLNQPYKDEIEKIVKYNITVGVSANSFVEELGKQDKTVKIHIEIGTGMGRTGINPKRVDEFISKINEYDNIKIEGIYTHLSSADTDDEYTKKQLESFETAVMTAKEKLGEIKYIHSLASNGILNYKDNKTYNLVRPGIILYGYDSCEDSCKRLELKPVCKLKSKITYLKDIKAGTSIGYSRSFIAKRDMKVATVPIGYADGIRRSLSNIGEVVINKRKAKIIGNICMDSFMIDVTDFDDVFEGEDVYIWDNDVITLDEVAEKVGTINYEIISTISNRVPRIFI